MLQHSGKITWGRVLAESFNFSKCQQLNDIHTHPFNGPISGTTRESRYQKGKTNLDFTEASTTPPRSCLQA